MAIRRFMGWGTALSVLCAAVLCVMLTGCKAEDPKKAATQDYALFSKLASRVPATAEAQPEEFELLFADDAVPNKKDRKIYLDKTLFVKPGDATVTGNTGTAQVTLQDPNTGDEVGVIEWTFERMSEADEWKIKTAPLP